MMKRTSVSFDQSYAVDDETKVKLKYQALLKEYLELQKEYVSRKRKLKAAKQQRETILAEVRFLRRRRKFLSKSQAPDTDNVPPFHLPNSYLDLQHSTSLENLDQLLVSNSHMKNQEAVGGNEQVHEKNVRLAKKLKDHLIQDKGVGKKRKINLPERVMLKVV